MLIDTHCHLAFSEFAADWLETLDRARQAGVQEMILVGTDLPSSEAAIALAETDPLLYATVGLHPHESAKHDSVLMQQFAALADHLKVVGIGETGLDYYYNRAPAMAQQAAFIDHIHLAREKHLALVIHAREAWKDIFSILTQEEAQKHIDDARLVFHCFTGDVAVAQEAMALGAYLSFSGIVTFPKATELQEAARVVADDKIVIETDAPYLSPQGHRGGRNEPAYLRATAKAVAALRSTTLDHFAKQTSDNAKRLFGL